MELALLVHQHSSDSLFLDRTEHHELHATIVARAAAIDVTPFYGTMAGFQVPRTETEGHPRNSDCRSGINQT